MKKESIFLPFSFFISLTLTQNWHYLGLTLRDEGVNIRQTIGGEDGVRSFLMNPSTNVIYVTGTFDYVGNQVPANYIAQWDDTNGWQSLGNGLSGYGSALAFNLTSGLFFVGGEFSRGVNMWNGNNFVNVSNGVDSIVYALAMNPNCTALFVGGNFGNAGPFNSVIAPRIAKFDGLNWFALNISTPAVYGLLVNNSNHLWLLSNNVYRYDLSLNFAQVIGVPGGSLQSIALNASSGDLIVGGGFNSMNGTSASMLARFDGSSWSGISGLWTTFTPKIYGLSFDSTYQNLYIAGTFDTGCFYAAKYSNGVVQCLGNGLNDNGLSVIATPTKVLFGGGFTAIRSGGPCLTGIAAWYPNTTAPTIVSPPSQYQSMGVGANSSVRTIGIFNSGDLFVGGDFRLIGGQQTNSFASWNGSSWKPLASSSSSINTVRAVVIGTDFVVFGGTQITQIDGQTGFRHIAMYKQGVWTNLNGGVGGSGQIFSLVLNTVNSNEFFAAGIFTQIGSGNNTVVTWNIARWNGSAWFPLQLGVSPSGVNSMAFDKFNILWVCGSFTNASGVITSDGIAKWDQFNNIWTNVSSMNGFPDCTFVYSMAFNLLTNELYVGGAFNYVAGLLVNYIVKFNGSHWSSLKSGLNYNVNSLFMTSDNKLYIGGGFSATADRSQRFAYITMWDGINFNQVEQGTNGDINTIVYDQGKLYLGGRFTRADFCNSNIVQIGLSTPTTPAPTPSTSTLVPTTEITTTEPLQDSSSGSNVGAVVGGVVGGIAASVLICFVVFGFCFVWRRRSKHPRNERENGKKNEVPLNSVLPQDELSPFRTKLGDDFVLNGVSKTNKKLGSGQFGEVWLGEWLGKKVALKTLTTNNDNLKSFVEEVSLARKLNSPSVIRVFGVTLLEGSIFAVLEYCENGSLVDYLHENKITEEQMIVLSYECAISILALEANKIVHRDIAARNFLLDSSLNVKLNDFGLARKLQAESDEYNQTSENAKLPVRWCAPEILSVRRFTYQSDLYAFGVCMWEIFTSGGTPFPQQTNSELISMFQNGQFPKLPKTTIPEDIFQIILSLTESDPNKRITIGEVISKLKEISNAKGIDLQKTQQSKNVIESQISVHSQYEQQPIQQSTYESRISQTSNQPRYENV